MDNVSERLSLLESSEQKSSVEISSLRTYRHESNKLLTHHEYAIKELLKAPTNQDLEKMLIEIRGDMKLVLLQAEIIKKDQVSHEEKDERTFKGFQDELSKIVRLTAMVGVICTILGGSAVKIFQSFDKPIKTEISQTK